MKCGLQESPLLQMNALFARQQPVAQYRAGALHHSALMMVAGVRDQHVLRYVGVKQHEDLSSCRTVAHQISVAPMQLFHVEKWIAAHRQQRRERQQGTWSWRGFACWVGGRTHKACVS